MTRSRYSEPVLEEKEEEEDEEEEVDEDDKDGGDDDDASAEFLWNEFWVEIPENMKNIMILLIYIVHSS